MAPRPTVSHMATPRVQPVAWTGPYVASLATGSPCRMTFPQRPHSESCDSALHWSSKMSPVFRCIDSLTAYRGVRPLRSGSNVTARPVAVGIRYVVALVCYSDDIQRWRAGKGCRRSSGRALDPGRDPRGALARDGT